MSATILDIIAAGSPTTIMGGALYMLWKRMEKQAEADRAEKTKLAADLSEANEKRHAAAEAHATRLIELAQARIEESTASTARVEAEKAVLEGLRLILREFRDILDTHDRPSVTVEDAALPDNPEPRHASHPARPRRSP
jgi:Na+-transporting NADH:ubiquinone oxidoreductase subunit NqrC